MGGKIDPDSRGRLPGRSTKKRTFGRPRKRKGFMKKNDEAPPAKKFKSTSAKKLPSRIEINISDTQYRIIDVNIVYTALENVVCCNQCFGAVKFSEKDIRGLGFQLVITCTQCGKEDFTNSCKKVGRYKNGFEVNRRLVLAMRTLGHGHAGSEIFCGIMDLPKPVVHSVHDDINVQLAKVCKRVAEASMDAALQEEIAALPEGRKGLSVSGDGTWRKKGFNSLQGVSSLIGIESDKVIARCVKNSYCKGCKEMENKKETAEYEEWYEVHKDVCQANHTGCAGKMEVNGILDMIKELFTKGIMIEFYIGDGDSKVYLAIKTEQLYGNLLTTSKKECIGHVQKRMGTRLRNLKKSYGNQKLSDGKTIGGKGRLTAKVMDQLTVYYGNAIRAHASTSVQEMKNAILATFFHKSSTDEKPQHHFCPEGENSWCTYQQAVAEGDESTYQHENGLPSAVMDILKSIYDDLSADELLERCLGGYTQNNNESFNNCIWKMLPKTSFNGLTVLKIGADIAVTLFNDGKIGLLKIMEDFDVQPGRAALACMKNSDSQRLLFAERRALDSTKEARTAMRRLRLGIVEDSYAPGAH